MPITHQITDRYPTKRRNPATPEEAAARCRTGIFPRSYRFGVGEASQKSDLAAAHTRYLKISSIIIRVVYVGLLALTLRGRLNSRLSPSAI